MSAIPSMTKAALGVMTAGLLAACASAQPPPELVDARAAYQHAESSPAKDAAPASLNSAKQALDQAEAKFADDGDSPKTRDMAYVAQRKAQLAEAKAGIERAEQAKAQAEKDGQNALATSAQQTQAELANTRDALGKERQARLDAERKAKEAMDALGKVAAVKQETRGMVITLSGAVLFASGKSALLPNAKAKLDDVAKALKEQEGSHILVEGHTDSDGNDAMNEKLSLDRANSVREYLVSQGIPNDRIEAKGLGENRPLVPNDSPANKANNRRVEIIVEPAKGGMGTTTKLAKQAAKAARICGDDITAD